jgi:membrane associated rhomboid family serine protease
MLILPMERTFDIRRPPVVTILLLIINVIVFMSTSGSDEEMMFAAVEAYEEQELLETELPVFLDYLIIDGGDADWLDGWQELDSVDDLAEHERFYLVMQILTDSNYADFLERRASSLTMAELAVLEQKQEILDSYINQMLVFRYGFVPSEFSFLTLFTSQFLHGDLAHLLGNMVILVLVGLTVEQLLGSFNFLLFYLISGAVGSAVFGLVHFGSPTPLVGASGAISGLMGMYVAAYGKKPIRFFYWIGIYFNYIKLPALVMLPIWVGKELFDFFFTESNVAYTAHAGGLVAGAGLVLLGRSSFAKIDTEVVENLDKDLEYREELENALAMVDRADFSAAKSALESLLEEHPGDVRVLFQLVQIAKAKPGTKTYHLATYNYLKTALQTGTASGDTQKVVRDYWSLALPKPMIKGELVAQIINKLIATGELELAKEIYKSAEEHQLLDANALNEAKSYWLAQQRSAQPAATSD